MPKVSVLMPAYNSEQFIAAAIESILNQTFTDFEFIIINDGSTDSTADIVRRYNDPRIKFIDNHENRGLIAVLNQGLDLCTGEYIARMDSDDISMPDRFEHQVAYLDKNPNVGILGGGGQNFGANTDINYSPQIVDATELLRGVGFYHPSVMMRTSVLDKYGLRYDPNYYLVEDHELWSRAVQVTELRNLQRILIKYRVHAASVSRANSELQEKNKTLVRHNILRYILKNVNKTKYYWITSCPLLKIQVKSKYNIKVWFLKKIPLLKIKYGRVYLFHFLPIKNIKFHRKSVNVVYFRQKDIKKTKIAQELSGLHRFMYIPNSGNMGDMLIAAATLQCFDKLKLNYYMYRGNNAPNIVYGGGGKWTDLYEKDWLPWLDVFQHAQRIIILPSSFHNCQKLINILDDRFTIFCREKKSFDYLKSAGTGARIYLEHDMAFYLSRDIMTTPTVINDVADNALRQISQYEIPYTIKVMRGDCESTQQYNPHMDLSSFCYGDEFSSKEFINCAAKIMLLTVSAAGCVITDRLHVAIAGALMGKDVYMLDNVYGKLSGVYKHSMTNCPNVYLCNKIPDWAA